MIFPTCLWYVVIYFDILFGFFFNNIQIDCDVISTTSKTMSSSRVWWVGVHGLMNGWVNKWRYTIFFQNKFIFSIRFVTVLNNNFPKIIVIFVLNSLSTNLWCLVVVELSIVVSWCDDWHQLVNTQLFYFGGWIVCSWKFKKNCMINIRVKNIWSPPTRVFNYFVWYSVLDLIWNTTPP